MEIFIIPVPKLSYCRWSPVFICCLRSIGVLPRCLQLISLCPYCIYCDQLIIYQFYIDHFRIDFVLQHCLIFFFVLLFFFFVKKLHVCECLCNCLYVYMSLWRIQHLLWKIVYLGKKFLFCIHYAMNVNVWFSMYQALSLTSICFLTPT